MISTSQSWQSYSSLLLFGLRVDTTEFWLLGCKERVLGQVFSYVKKKKQSLKDGSLLLFLNAAGEGVMLQLQETS